MSENEIIAEEATYKIGIETTEVTPKTFEVAVKSAHEQCKMRGFTLLGVLSVDDVSTDAHRAAGERLIAVRVLRRPAPVDTGDDQKSNSPA